MDKFEKKLTRFYLPDCSPKDAKMAKLLKNDKHRLHNLIFLYIKKHGKELTIKYKQLFEIQFNF